MVAGATPEAAARPPPDCTAISQLHVTLRDMMSRLHDAIYMLPRQAPPPGPTAANGAAPPVAGATFSDIGYTVDLLEMSKRFERLVALIPDDMCDVDGDHFAEELCVVSERDRAVDESVARLTARLEFVQAVTRKSLRDTCEELCADMVRCEDAGASEPEEADAPPVEIGAEVHKANEAGPAMAAPRPRLVDLKQDRSRRFIEELEFVQSLANPDYVQHLATQKYFEDPSFIQFLRYLRYWRDPPHVYHVVYPQSLRMLEILVSPRIQNRLHRLDTRNLLLNQMMLKWASTPELGLPGVSGSDIHKVMDTLTTYGEEGPPLAPPGEKAEIIEDWTKFAGVAADRAGHEDIEALDAAACTITRDAEEIGRMHLQQQFRPDDGHVERSFEKHKHYWANPLSSCDLESLAAAPATAVQATLEPSGRVLELLGLKAAVGAERHGKRGREEQAAHQQKRGRR